MALNSIFVIKYSISLCSIYAHVDTSLYQKLEKHLSPLKRDGLISLCSIDMVAPSDETAVEIEHHLNTAQIILLLMSADFFADEHCHQMIKRS